MIWDFLKLKKNWVSFKNLSSFLIKISFSGGVGALTFGLALYVLAHIEEVPYTKRRRFILFSRQDMRNLCENVQDEVGIILIVLCEECA